MAAPRLVFNARRSLLSFLLAVLAVTVYCSNLPDVTSPRLPRNARCPHHGYPFSDKAYADFVYNHALTLPGLAERMATEDPVWMSKSITDFVFGTADYAAKFLSKIAPIDSRRPFQFKLDCSSAKYKGIFSGVQRNTSATIIWSSRFNFETPLLLYRLHAYKDLVDFHFISETERVDFSSTPKPMMFERVKGHFQEFLHQIVHHVIDDTSYGRPFQWSKTTTTAMSDTWGHERHHFNSILAPLLRTFHDYPADSIVLHGDVDEMPDEDFVYHMKHCELVPNVRLPIRSHAVMWLSDYRYVFKASMDDPNPFSFRFPLFYTLGYLRQQDVKTFYWRKSSPGDLRPSLPGGWHFSYMLFPPTFYMKMFSMAESGGRRFLSTGRARTVHRELAERRDHGGHWGSASITHPTCLVQKYPEYKDFADTVPWLVAQNVQQFAFFVPCQPAFYDTDDALSKDYGNCSMLFRSG